MIKTGLFKRGSNIQPKIERTKKGELIYVFADGSWKYYWEWIATAPQDQFNLLERLNLIEKQNQHANNNNTTGLQGH